MNRILITLAAVAQDLADDTDRLARLRSLGKRFFPDGYDTEADIVKNGLRAEMLEFTIDHLSGKAVREK